MDCELETLTDDIVRATLRFVTALEFIDREFAGGMRRHRPFPAVKSAGEVAHMVEIVERGSASFLQQAHQNNWQQYLASLKPGAALGWDVCVLTASDERQAFMFQRQLDWRREGGLLPARTRFVVAPDPDGRRIGSGGATLRVLSQLGVESPRSERVLLIHSGGDSRRLPHCSATGKLFARVPRELPDGRASTVFDEFFISLCGLTANLSPGVLVASGDVLLIFDHLQVSFERPGVIGVAAASPVATGIRHGVYAADKESKRLRAYLHKPTYSELATWDAIDAEGRVQIDTGLVWLDGPTIQKLVEISTEEPVAEMCGLADNRSGRGSGTLNLYGDMLLPLAESTTLEGYLADTSDGPATPSVQDARRVIWERLRGTTFSVERVQPAVFVHLGTSEEYWEITAGDPELRATCGWNLQTASWAESSDSGEEGGERVSRLPDDRLVLINAVLEKPVDANAGSGARVNAALVTDSHIKGSFSWQGAAIVAGVRTKQPVALGEDLVLQQLPISGGGYVTRLYGLRDDPKRRCTDQSATFMNQSWSRWQERMRIPADLLWEGVQSEERSLWNAQLYPVTQDREESLGLSLPLFAPERAPTGWREGWLALPRMSLAQSFAQAEGGRILTELADIEESAAARRFYSAIKAEQPATGAIPLLGTSMGSLDRRSKLAAALFAESGPLLRLRGYKALALALGNSHWEDEAFAGLASMIEATTIRASAGSHRTQAAGASGRTAIRDMATRLIRVAAAARIDFGGGWTDTPPYSIERGGTVLNAAITLRGVHPVISEAEHLQEPRLILESRDIGATIEPERAGEVLAFANPADPFALHKAALVLRGIIPGDADPAMPIGSCMAARGAGLRLSTESSIPRGSGLGTSSIMAGVVLESLRRLLDDRKPSGKAKPRAQENESEGTLPLDAQARLFDEVLYLEQMLTTGGGWQDQVGGLTGGIKLVKTEPGLPQLIHVEAVRLPAKARAEMAERLVLVYTGQQRLAKNLLRGVMGRWMARDPEMVWILKEIARLAVAMKGALESGDFDDFGRLLAEHWALNKQMDPGCTNPFIDRLFETIAPIASGGKLAGAGGGGFAIVVARSRDAVEEMRTALSQRFSGTPVAIWDCAVPTEGMVWGV